MERLWGERRLETTETDILEQLYHRYYSAAYLYCLSLSGDAHTAQDITADAFVKAYLSLPDEVPSFRYWLFRVCKNLWIDHCRKQRHLAEPDALEFLPDPNTPESIYLRNEQKKALWAALNTLSPTDREIITLHYFSGLPLKEIAPLLGKSHDAVRQRMVRLRNKLREELEAQGYGR
ncbi:MAG: sigma-70 family RNA polymerase sigma factor [Ruminococcaceae bacterium]|nr:sigma-70 family RNA polymerase sigma factor [Oscillospiraceae bacterium]